MGKDRAKASYHWDVVGPLLLIPLCLAAAPDRWGSPRPAIYVSQDNTIAFKVVPYWAKDTPGARGTLYELDSEGRERVLWQRELVNVPLHAFVHSEQRVVTFDTHYHAGFQHALVIYNAKGIVVADFHLDQLLKPSERAGTVQSVSSRWWWSRDGVSFKPAHDDHFLRRPPVMTIQVNRYGEKPLPVLIDLDSGKRIAKVPPPKPKS